MALQFGHETLAEPHYLRIGLAARGEVGTAFRTAHRERGKRVLEGLLEGEEFHDTQVHTCVEADTAFVGTDGGVHLYAEAAIDLHLALVVHPRHAEHNHALGFDHALQHFLLAQVGISEHHRCYAFQHFFYSLMKLQFTRILTHQFSHKLVNVLLNLFVHKIYLKNKTIGLLLEIECKGTAFF